VYKPKWKVENFKNPAIFLQPAETYCSNMVVSKKIQQTFLGFAMG
jgi:hypothetical protein